MTAQNSDLLDTVYDVLTTTPTPADPEVKTLADGLFAVADAIGSLARAVQYLGNGDAATGVGAIEGLAMQVRDGCDRVASALSEPNHDLSDLTGAVIDYLNR